MKVWIVMCNEFPDSVYDTEAGARAEAARLRAAGPTPQGPTPQIRWRVYECTLQEEGLPPC